MHVKHGQLVANELCNASGPVLTFLAQADQLKAFDSIDQDIDRVQELNRFDLESSVVLRALKSARFSMQDIRLKLQNSSSSEFSDVAHLLAGLNNNTNVLDQIVQNRWPEVLSKIVHASNRLLLDVDVSTLKDELSSLHDFRQRYSVLIRSRYWGSPVQDHFLEPIVDHFNTRYRKPSILTGHCFSNWMMRSRNTLLNNISAFINVSVSQCENLGFPSACCREAVQCYGSCRYSKSACDADFARCMLDALGPESERVKLRHVPPSSAFLSARQVFCVCQKDPVRPSKITGLCPAFFTQRGQYCDAIDADGSTELDVSLHPSNQDWISAASIVIDHFRNTTVGTASMQMQNSLLKFIECLNTNRWVNGSRLPSFANWMNVSQTLSVNLLRENTNELLLPLSMSRSPRPSPDWHPQLYNFIQASISQSVRRHEASNAMVFLREHLAAIHMIRKSIMQTFRSPQVSKVISMRGILADFLDEEACILQSAQKIKASFLELKTARNLIGGITLEAFKQAAANARSRLPEIAEAFAQVQSSDIDAMRGATTLLDEREKLLSALKLYFEPSGARL